MIIDNISFESIEYHSLNSAWSTIENIKIEFHYPSKNKVSLTGFVTLPFTKAKNMSLEELNDYVKDRIREKVEGLEE